MRREAMSCCDMLENFHYIADAVKQLRSQLLLARRTTIRAGTCSLRALPRLAATGATMSIRNSLPRKDKARADSDQIFLAIFQDFLA